VSGLSRKGERRLGEVREVLEDALLRLATAEGEAATRRQAEGAVSGAIGDVDAALADFSRFAEGTASALSKLRGAADRMPAPASAILAECVAALLEVEWAPSPKSPPPLPGHNGLLAATVGEPALLDFTRGPIRAHVPIFGNPEERLPAPPPVLEEAPEPRPLTLAELEAALAGVETDEEEQEPQRERKPAADAARRSATQAETEQVHFGVALGEEQILLSRARTCTEDLALLGMMRRPLPDQGWAGRAGAEQRLLARVDAIAACGEAVLPHLVEMLEERPVPDPELTWALLFLFGSIGGDDAADQAMRLARIVPLEAEGMLEAVADALALCPHPRVAPALAAWLGSSAAARRLVAVRALARREALTAAQAMEAATDADARVSAAGAAALGAIPGPVDLAALSKLARHDDEAVARAALESALIRRSDLARRRTAQLLEEGRPDHASAAVLFAIASGPGAAELLSTARTAGSTSAVEATGWYGHAGAIPDLLDRLEGPGAAAAVLALQLITGASVTDADPGPEYQDGEGPFTAAERPVPVPVVLTMDPAPWRAWWKAHGKAARPDVRYRFGRPWCLADDLRQIEAPLATPRERRLAHLELCARSGASLPFDPQAFVARQRRQILAWSAAVARRAAGQGGWPVKLEPAA
jgi:hypothetical protein